MSENNIYMESTGFSVKEVYRQSNMHTSRGTDYVTDRYRHERFLHWEIITRENCKWTC